VTRPLYSRVSLIFVGLLLATMTRGFGQSHPDQFPNNVRGTNYAPGTTVALNNVVAMLPIASPGAAIQGQFDPAIVSAELRRIRQSGINNIRLLPAFWGWVIDRAAYMSVLKTLSQLCNREGITITYQVWSAIRNTGEAMSADGIPSSDLWHELAFSSPSDPTNYTVLAGTLARSAVHQAEFIQSGGTLPPGEPWLASILAEPGNELMQMSGDYTVWPFQMATRIDMYLDAIATFFATDPDGRQAFASYDLFNEPDGTPFLTVPAAHYVQFIKTTYDRIMLHHGSAEFCVGWSKADATASAHDQMILAAGVGRTYHSVHTYSTVDRFGSELAASKAYADAQGVPLVLSEFYRTDHSAGTLKYLLNEVQQIGIGAQVWGVIQSNHFVPTAFGSYPLDGLHVGTPTGNSAQPLAFHPNNTADLMALEAWTSGTLTTPDYTSVAATDWTGTPVSTITAGSPLDFSVSSSRIGDPILLIMTALAGAAPPPCFTSSLDCVVVPGLGPVIANASTTVLSLGTLGGTGTQTFPGVLAAPPGMTGGTLAISAYVGTYPTGDFNQNVGEFTGPLELTFQ